MIYHLLLLCYLTIIESMHFNGGIIRWMPTDPYDNSTSLTITIIQSYYWTYPAIQCANPVPITTVGRSTQNVNLTCVTDCSTDGNYSAHPVDILTDCTSVSSSLDMLTSERSVNVTLNSGAHFYLAHVGAAWTALNYPAQSGLDWSIVTFIDLRPRPDGFINTPPVVSIISPQYAIVNQTIHIDIPVFDVNSGDDVRCRWSIYTPGSRRRRQLNDEEEKLHAESNYLTTIYKKQYNNREIIYIREKRAKCTGSCSSSCAKSCACSCASCKGTTCNGTSCNVNPSCSVATTTAETPGTIKSTLSYPNRQAIDECGGICHPDSLPNGTTLSGCTLSFTGPIPNTWYGVALQVEDFINTTSSIPMSSVPVQFLIYVMDEPACGLAPVIIPLESCLEVQVGVSINFSVSAMTLCDPSVSDINTIIISGAPNGVNASGTIASTSNTSISYSRISWTPSASQVGTQQLCFVAYTDEQIQSAQYCVMFTVTTSSVICTTTTTTSTTASTTTSITSTTSITTTSSRTTTTTMTTVTTVTTATTITTASTTTTTTTTRTTTTTKTTTTITTITTTTTTKTTSTTTTSTSSTSTSTTATTTTVTVAVAAATTTDNAEKSPSWGLIVGVASLALPLGLATFCCLYRLCWSPAAKRRRRQIEDEERWEYNHLTSSTQNSLQTETSHTNESVVIEVPGKSYQVCGIQSQTDRAGSILVAIYNNTNAGRANSSRTNTSEEGTVMENAWMHSATDQSTDKEISIVRRNTLVNSASSDALNMKVTKETSQNNDPQLNQESTRSVSAVSLFSDPLSILHSKYNAQQSQRAGEKFT